MLSVSPTAKHWTSWPTFINVGTAGHGIVIFDFPVNNMMNIQPFQLGMTLAPHKDPEIMCGNRSLKDTQLLFQYFFLHYTLTWQLMQKFCFAIHLVLVTNEPVEIHTWNLVQVYDEHVYRPDHKMIPVGASMWHDAWELWLKGILLDCYLQEQQTSSSTAHRLKTSHIWSSVLWMSALTGCFQDEK